MQLTYADIPLYLQAMKDYHFGAVFSRPDILRLIQTEPPLIEGLSNIEEQIQPNGVDLTVSELAAMVSVGAIGIDNKDRRLSETSPVDFNAAGTVRLSPGCYLLTFHEIVHLPKNVMALGFPRSSLTRCGVSIHTAVWDAGYEGRSQSLLIVYNPYGFKLERYARVLQLVFFRLEKETDVGYHGAYQRENI